MLQSASMAQADPYGVEALLIVKHWYLSSGSVEGTPFVIPLSQFES